MLLKVKICGDVWIQSFLPCIPVLVQLEGWWPPPWPSWTTDGAESWMFQTLRYCLHGLWLLGIDGDRESPGKKPHKTISYSLGGEQHLKTTWAWCTLHRSPNGGVSSGPTTAPFKPAATAEVLLIWLSSMCGNLLYYFLKSDVFKGNIYPQSSLTCDDSINCRLARKTNLLQGI